jgi:hypothetical protein
MAPMSKSLAYSLFTNGDMSPLPQMGRSHPHAIASFQIQDKGIAKLLYKLNINKASGPEAADEIAVFVSKD